MGEQFLNLLIKNLRSVGHRLGDFLSAHAFNILIILFGAWVVRRFSSEIISKLFQYTIRIDLFPNELDRKKRIQTLDSLVGAAVRVLVYVIAATMIIAELGINTAPLLASAGVLGVALGFGAQSLIKDFASGIFIISENQYRVGDVVELAGKEGKVESLTIRTTTIRDLNGSVHHIPNGQIVVTTNQTFGFGRLNEEIIVNYKTEIEKLEHVVNHVGQEMMADPGISKFIIDQPAFDRIVSFEKDGLKIRISGKTRAAKKWLIKGELFRRLKKAFEHNHIKLAGQ